MWFSRQRTRETRLEEIKSPEQSLLKHKGTSSTHYTSSPKPDVTPNSILKKKYQNITDHYLAFDIIAMSTLRKGSKALTEWQEVQLSIPGEYDYFNGYCTSNKYAHHLGIALKYHQFNIDKPAFYRLDEVADIHELNLVRKKMLQKRAIEEALKNLTKEQIDACFVNLEDYMFIRPIITEDGIESIDEKMIEIPHEYTVFKAVPIPIIIPPVLDKPTPTPPLVISSTIESYYWIDKEKLFHNLDSSEVMIDQDCSITCPSYFSFEPCPAKEETEETNSANGPLFSLKKHIEEDDPVSSVPIDPTFLQKIDEICYHSPSIKESKLNTSHYLLKNRVSISHRKEETPRKMTKDSNFTSRRVDIGAKLISKKREAYPNTINLKPTDQQESSAMNHFASSKLKVDITKSRLFESRNMGLSSIENERPSFSVIKKTIKDKYVDSPTLSPTQSKSKMSSFIIKLGSKTPKTQDRPPSSLDFQQALNPRQLVSRSNQSRSPTAYKMSRPKVGVDSRLDSELIKAEEVPSSTKVRIATSFNKNRRSVREESHNRSKASTGLEEVLPLKNVLPLDKDWKKGIFSNIMKNKAGIFSMYQQPRKTEAKPIPLAVSTKIPGLVRTKHILRTPTKD